MKSSGSPIIVTVDNILSYSEDEMNLFISEGGTVMDIKKHIYEKNSTMIPSEQILLHDGRILNDEEAIHDLLEEDIEQVSGYGL